MKRKKKAAPFVGGMADLGKALTNTQTFGFPAHLVERATERLLPDAKRMFPNIPQSVMEETIRELRFAVRDGVPKPSDDEILEMLPTFEEMLVGSSDTSPVKFVALLRRIERFVRAVDLNERLEGEGREHRDVGELVHEAISPLEAPDVMWLIHWLARQVDPVAHSEAVKEVIESMMEGGA